MLSSAQIARIAVLPVAAWGLSPAAHAQNTAGNAIFKTGDELYAACTAVEPAKVAQCEWFLMAAHDMAAYYSDIGQAPATFCLRSGTGVAELRKITTDYWRERPASRKFSAVSSFLNALNAARPGACKR